MKTEEELLKEALQKDLGLVITEHPSLQKMKESLVLYINDLINTDFEKLVFYLYRIDVDEEKMRYLLAQKENQSSAELIAELIIERQLQKIKYRSENKDPGKESGEERW